MCAICCLMISQQSLPRLLMLKRLAVADWQVESLQQLLDTLWKSYTQETLRDSTKVGGDCERVRFKGTSLEVAFGPARVD